MAIETSAYGSTTITGKRDIELFALINGISAMKMYVRSGGKMLLTRGATPKNIAERFGIIDPKTKKTPKTGARVLQLLEEKYNADSMSRNLEVQQGKADKEPDGMAGMGETA